MSGIQPPLVILSSGESGTITEVVPLSKPKPVKRITELKIKLQNKEEAPSFFAHVGRQIKLGYYEGSWYDGSTWEITENKKEAK